MIGLETALSIVNKTMVESGLLDWTAVADRMSTAPARIGRYSSHGQNLTLGSAAHITVINPSKSWVVDRDLVISKSRNTPFHGYELPGLVTHTFFGGRATMIDSKVIDKVVQ
jgi:dihydroorotase